MYEETNPEQEVADAQKVYADALGRARKAKLQLDALGAKLRLRLRAKSKAGVVRRTEAEIDDVATRALGLPPLSGAWNEWNAATSARDWAGLQLDFVKRKFFGPRRN